MSRKNFERDKTEILEAVFRLFMSKAELTIIELRKIDKDDDGKLTAYLDLPESCLLLTNVFERAITEMKAQADIARSRKV